MFVIRYYENFVVIGPHLEINCEFLFNSKHRTMHPNNEFSQHVWKLNVFL